jgi:predicted DNA-binding transcriptional regulator AlpA
MPTVNGGLRPWDGLAAPISSDRALLGPEACQLLRSALDRYSRIEGVALSPQAAHVRSVLDLVARQACIGHSDVRSVPASAGSESWIGTSEVSELLGFSVRHCLRLMQAEAFGTPRRTGGRWKVPADEVAAYAAERTMA